MAPKAVGRPRLPVKAPGCTQQGQEVKEAHPNLGWVDDTGKKTVKTPPPFDHESMVVRRTWGGCGQVGVWVWRGVCVWCVLGFSLITLGEVLPNSGLTHECCSSLLRVPRLPRVLCPVRLTDKGVPSIACA